MTILFIIKFNFNQPLNINSLPPKLTHLTFGEHFNQPLNLLHLNLKELIININHSKDIQYSNCNIRYIN